MAPYFVQPTGQVVPYPDVFREWSNGVWDRVLTVVYLAFDSRQTLISDTSFIFRLGQPVTVDVKSIFHSPEMSQLRNAVNVSSHFWPNCSSTTRTKHLGHWPDPTVWPETWIWTSISPSRNGQHAFSNALFFWEAVAQWGVKRLAVGVLSGNEARRKSLGFGWVKSHLCNLILLLIHYISIFQWSAMRINSWGILNKRTINVILLGSSSCFTAQGHIYFLQVGLGLDTSWDYLRKCKFPFLDFAAFITMRTHATTCCIVHGLRSLAGSRLQVVFAHFWLGTFR